MTCSNKWCKLGLVTTWLKQSVMDFLDQVKNLSQTIQQIKESVLTEEATKQAFRCLKYVSTSEKVLIIYRNSTKTWAVK